MKIVRPIIVNDTGTFTRASTAMYWGSDGFLHSAAINTPRFSYNPANISAGPALLVEAAATNLILQSQALGTSPWSLSNATVNATAGTGLDNTTTANSIIESSTNTVHNTSQAITVSTALPYTFSVYLKAGARTFARIQIDNAGTNGVYADLNLSTGVASSITTYGTGVVASTVTLTPVGSASINTGWYRAAISIASSTYTTLNAQIYLENTLGNTVYLGDGVSNIFVWGAQFEQSAVATSYYPTTTSTATRSADSNTAMLTTNIPEMDYPEWNSGTTYAQGAFVIVTLTGGAPHYVYQSLVASNLNNPPATSGSQWVRVGADNRWRLFDSVVTDQTTQTNGFSLAITPNARYDSIVGLNCAATSCNINVIDPVYGNVYSNTVQLTSFSGIQDWYAYFYEPIVQQTDFSVNDIPVAYSTSTVTVTFNGTGTVATGEVVIGLSKEIGYSEWGSKVSIIDYSVKTKDNFGNYVITPRNFSKRADLSIQVPTSTVDFLESLLASYRTTPIVYIGSNASTPNPGQPTPTAFNSTVIFGFYKDFQIDITYSQFATCSLQIEGLT